MTKAETILKMIEETGPDRAAIKAAYVLGTMSVPKSAAHHSRGP